MNALHKLYILVPLALVALVGVCAALAADAFGAVEDWCREWVEEAKR